MCRLLISETFHVYLVCASFSADHSTMNKYILLMQPYHLQLSYTLTLIIYYYTLLFIN